MTVSTTHGDTPLLIHRHANTTVTTHGYTVFPFAQTKYVERNPSLRTWNRLQHTYIAVISLVVLGVKNAVFRPTGTTKCWGYFKGLRDDDVTERGESCVRPFCAACPLPRIALHWDHFTRRQPGQRLSLFQSAVSGFVHAFVVLWVTVRIPGFNSPYLRALLEAVCCLSGWNVFPKNGTPSLVIGQMLKNFQRMYSHHHHHHHHHHVVCLTTGP